MKTTNNDYVMQPEKSLKLWKAALYIRLSREDEGDKVESCSVTSQREILKEYVKQHDDIELYDIYIDDGWSGTNFDRPDFRRMMSDINSGNVNCVIVKDLSRFGRNAVDSGYYLDTVFTQLRVRFIAINNAVDTFSGNMNAATHCITVGVQNVINESVAATTSVNVRASLNIAREKGHFIGSFSTYGYLKDPNDHHKLIIDEEVAPIVEQIFSWFIGGKSVLGIARELNAMGVPNPSAYKKLKGMKYHHRSLDSSNGLWPDSSVRRILKNQMYIGNMVQGKNQTVSYKIKQCRAIPQDEWIIVEGTHEPIIDKETFYKAQSLFNKHVKSTKKTNDVDLFAGLVRCADCKRIVSKKTNNLSYGTYEYYRCSTHVRMDKNACSKHTIRIDKLKRAVLITLQKTIDTATELSELVEEISKNPHKNRDTSHLRASLDLQLSEREKAFKMQTDLYPDMKSGLISMEEYLSLKKSIENKIKSLDEKIESIKVSIEGADGISLSNDFMEAFKKYGEITELTRPMLIDLVDEILVGENERIQVNFKFKDSFEQVMEYISQSEETEKSA